MIIVLHQPQIPQNTGNIVRTCAVTGSQLVLVAPLGFSTSNRMLKRSGLDYWLGVDVQVIDHFEPWMQQQQGNVYFFSSKATRCYSTVSYQANDALVFGAETHGLPEHYAQQWPDAFLTIPMRDKQRCLNLANAAAIVVYEAWRQQGFR